MIVYADILIILNFLVDYFILLLTAKFLEIKYHIFRLLLAATLGGMSSLYIFLPSVNTLTDFLYKFKKEQPFAITREGNNSWRISGKEIEKILIMTKFSTDESVMRFANKLRKLGIDAKLRELGAQEGDTIHILDFEFDYKE